jgi:hypothetical protein
MPLPSVTFTVAIAYTDDTPSPGGAVPSARDTPEGNYDYYSLEVDECLTTAEANTQNLKGLSVDAPPGQGLEAGQPSQIGDCTTAGQNPGA